MSDIKKVVLAYSGGLDTSVAVAWLIAAWLPTVGDISANSQISSRIEPSLLDFCIAILAGAALVA